MAIANQCESFVESSFDPPVRGFLHQPVTNSGEGLVLTHGAGGNCQAASLVTLAEAFASAGFTVLRCNLPYRQARSYGPPRPGDAARDREGLKNAVEALRKVSSGRMFLGGHSYGGRQASMLCADQRDLVGGLVLCSYPLHPPGKPEQLRVQHLPKVQVPVLFVEGTHDAFATIAEIESARKLIPARTALLQVEGAGHDLGFKRKSRRDDWPPQAVAEFQKLIAPS